MTKGTILLCAGGTGGHLFPAEALAYELIGRGWEIHLATDDRAERFSEKFPATETHIIRSATFGGKNPIALFKALKSLFSGYRQSQSLLADLKPKAVVGFGGYPTVPPVFAASRIGIPSMVHEQNAVLGRANKMLAPRVQQVAMGFAAALGADSGSVVVTGNPVRPAVVEAMGSNYPARKADDSFNLLIFGGSQGAQYFSHVLPQAIAKLLKEDQANFRITQQARPEDATELLMAYRNLGISAKVETFFDNMAGLIADSHLVISRAGASTVSELAVIGRPCVLVPYPFALDHDQAANAAEMMKSGAAQVVKQSELDPDALANILKSAIDDPKKLALAAKNAKNTGKPNAAAHLADCVENMIAA